MVQPHFSAWVLLGCLRQSRDEHNAGTDSQRYGDAVLNLCWRRTASPGRNPTPHQSSGDGWLFWCPVTSHCAETRTCAWGNKQNAGKMTSNLYSGELCLPTQRCLVICSVLQWLMRTWQTPCPSQELPWLVLKIGVSIATEIRNATLWAFYNYISSAVIKLNALKKELRRFALAFVSVFILSKQTKMFKAVSVYCRPGEWTEAFVGCSCCHLCCQTKSEMTPFYTLYWCHPSPYPW